MLVYFQTFKMESQVDETEHFRYHFLHLIEVLRPTKMLVRFVLCMEKNQCLKVSPAVGFWALKMGILTPRTEYTPVGQMSLMKSDWINFFMKIDVKHLKNRCNRCTVIKNHLRSMGMVQKLGSWVPHSLSENDKNKRSTMAASLLVRHRSTHGHKQRFHYTGHRKWRLHVNMKQRKEWLSSQNQATPRAEIRLSSSKDHVACMARLGRHKSLRTVWAQLNTECGVLSLTIAPTQWRSSAKRPNRRNGILP